ncbi:hypothetical protein [Trinickia sp. EG282A]|uniref:hypothetical protein n=1 Tax=Trinickia sp. EG282A TaxID=3237013 RepID=UPI0034D15770
MGVTTNPIAGADIERGQVITLQVTTTSPDSIKVGDVIRFWLYRSRDGKRPADGFLPTDQDSRNSNMWSSAKTPYVDVKATAADTAELEVFHIDTEDGSDPVWCVENTTTPWATPIVNVAMTLNAYELEPVSVGIAPDEVHLTQSNGAPPDNTTNNYFTIDFQLEIQGDPPTAINDVRMGPAYLAKDHESGQSLDLTAVALWTGTVGSTTSVSADADGKYYFRSDSGGHVNFFITGKTQAVFQQFDLALGNTTMGGAEALLFVNLDRNGAINAPEISGPGVEGNQYEPPANTGTCPIAVRQGTGAGVYVAGDVVYVFNKTKKRLLQTVYIKDPDTDLATGYDSTFESPLTTDNFVLVGDNVLVGGVVRGSKLFVTQSKSYLFNVTEAIDPNEPPYPGGYPKGFTLKRPQIEQLGASQVGPVDYDVCRYGLTIKAQWDANAQATLRPDAGDKLTAKLYLNGWAAGTDDERHGAPSRPLDVDATLAASGTAEFSFTYADIMGYGPRLHVPDDPNQRQDSLISVQVSVARSDGTPKGYSTVLGPLIFSSVIPGMTRRDRSSKK